MELPQLQGDRVSNAAEWIVWSACLSWKGVCSDLVSCHLNEFLMTALGYLNLAIGFEHHLGKMENLM